MEYDPKWIEAKWAEVERRMMAQEERIADLMLRVTTHEAVCVERQKSMFNVIATLDQRMIEIGKSVEKISNRFLSYHTAITSALFMVCLGLISLVWTHYPK